MSTYIWKKKTLRQENENIFQPAFGHGSITPKKHTVWCFPKDPKQE